MTNDRIIKIPKGYVLDIWIQNNRPEGTKFYFSGPSISVANDSFRFGQEQVKLTFRRTGYNAAKE